MVLQSASKDLILHLADLKLGNMVVNEYLENQGVDLKCFQQLCRSDQPLSKLRLNRTIGGDITVPVPRTNKEIKETLKLKLV